MKYGTKVITIQPDRLWQITLKFPPIIGMSTNCWLLNGSDGLSLIDCGCATHAEEIVQISREIGEIKRILITHAHPDHAGAAAAISRALSVPVLAHENELDYLKGLKTISGENGSMICKCILWMADVSGFIVPKVENIVALQNNQEIEGLNVIHTPGHTPGSISLFEPSLHALFCGDNLHTMFSKPVLGHEWFTLDKKVRNSGLTQYERLDANRLLAGHGKPYESGSLKNELKRLISST